MNILKTPTPNTKILHKIPDVKELFLSYNHLKHNVEFYELDKDGNHFFLKSKNTEWTKEQLEEKKQNAIELFNEIKEEINKKFNLNTDEENFWNNQHITLKPGLIFKRDSLRQQFTIVEDEYDLEFDLINNKNFREELQKNHDLSVDLYRALCNVTWVKNGIHWSCSWRTAGAIVANLRDQREDYLEFYCSGDEGNVTESISEVLSKMNWFESE